MRTGVALSLVLSSLLASRLASGDDAAHDSSAARGWVGVQQRDVWGLTESRAIADYGADVLGGLWLLHEHLQPIVDVGWSRVFGLQNGETIDTFRAGGKLAVGCAISHESIWVGGTLGLVAQAGWLHVTGTSLAWAASPSVSGLVQGRVARRLLVGAELGVEHSIPALEWGAVSIFHAFRLQLGIQLGVLLGDPVPE